jgi:hypothetical protein
MSAVLIEAYAHFCYGLYFFVLLIQTRATNAPPKIFQNCGRTFAAFLAWPVAFFLDGIASH